MSDIEERIKKIAMRWKGIDMRVKPTPVNLLKAAQFLGLVRKDKPVEEVIPVSEEAAEAILGAISGDGKKPLEASIEL